MAKHLRNSIIYTLLIGLSILTGQGICSAQTITTITQNYSGTIGKYPIELQLQFTKGKDSISGSYYYLKNGKSATLWLRGIKTPNGSLLFTEQDYRQRDQQDQVLKTGHFSLSGKEAMAGNWKHQQSGKQLPVNLTLRENCRTMHPEDYRFQYHTYKAATENAAGRKDPYTRINRLDIYAKGKLLQSFTGFDECVADDFPEIIMEDLNFDSCLDLKVPIYFPERTKYDGSFLYFIFNRASGKFERHQQMIDMEYLDFDPVKKEVYRYDQGNGGFIINYYQWKNGQLYLSRTEKDQ